ncbi:MAG: hypothetical protein JSV86_04395 [Gemmatimonadota bacterium]|nr:MAG: hypothetical protein JSV86_04395 [Gemmatimonadota bacterium]
MSDSPNPKACLACQRDTAVTPLIPLEYRDSTVWICPQHLPVLIHDPARLVGVLPGAENLSPADHHD